MYVSSKKNKIFLRKLKILNTQQIILIGGEPMAHPELSNLIDDIVEIGIPSISIITNGTILKPEILKRIVEYGIEVQISLDGHTEEINSKTRGIGSFNKVMENVKLFKQYNVNYSIMQVLTSETIKFSKEFSDFCTINSIPHGFFVVKQSGLSERPTIVQLHSLYDFLLKKYNDVNSVFNCVKSSDQMQFETLGFPVTHCGAAINSVSVDPSGNVYPCVKMHRKKYLITNLCENNAVEQIKLNRKLTLKNDVVDSLEKCNDCTIKYICGGGCRADEDYIIENSVNYNQCELQKSNLNYFLENADD